MTGPAQSVERLIAEGRRFDFRDPTNTERSSSTQRFIAVILVRFLPPGVAGDFFAFGVTEILLSGHDLYVLLFRVDRGKVSAPF